MKTRIISASVGIVIFTVIFFFYETFLFNAAVSVAAMIAVYELLHSTKFIQSKLLLALNMAFSATIPFINTDFLEGKIILIAGIYVFLLFVSMFVRKCKFEQVTIMFTVSLLVSYAFSSLVFIRDIYLDNVVVGLYYVLLVFLCSWISDTGAYFTGRALGKHKLAPVISPKKTIEGAIGGVVFCIVFGIAFTFLFFEIVKMMTPDFVYSVNIIALLVTSLIASCLSIFGDLTASFVKRQCSIKDFGHLIPGHGGVIDRFDSVLFVAALIYSSLLIGVNIIN